MPQGDAWLWDFGKEEAKNFIQIFVSTKKDEEKKMKFLESICTMCRDCSLLEDMDAFCREMELAENIKVLLEEEPTDSLHTAFRMKAMLTIATLSATVESALDDKKESLLHACFKSVFFLPPYLDMSAAEKDLYTKTMNAMEIMLQAFVRNCPISSVGKELQNILQALLHYANSHNTAVRKIALQKIERMSDFLVTYLGKTLFTARKCKGSPGTHKEVHIPILGQLLGHLFIFSGGKDTTRIRALDALYHFYAFLTEGRECILREDMVNYAERHKKLEYAKLPFSIPSTPCEIAKGFGGYLLPDESLTDRVFWACSTDLAMWEVILAMPKTLNWVLNFMMGFLQLCYWCTAVSEDTCIRRLAMLAQNESYEFGNPVHLQSYLRHPSPEMRFLVLKGLCTVSESPEKAREIQVLLPDILEALQDTNTDVVLKALLVLKNVMAHVERRKASGPALQLAEKLLPFFDHESSHMREHSICLFQAVVEAVLRQRKKEMKRTVHRSLLPLYFHMRDQSESVAKASGEALAVTAEFLRCKELKRLAQTEQTWRIGECLLQQDRGRVEEYLQQSQPYLQATQTDLRLEAVRFIGEPSPWSRPAVIVLKIEA
ncbi:uncharacterized protein [Anas platyrhynchos]|uniref:uncharacterized protein n=1 Tax=Anas platyrhynchos TaxID=8839 RepID=UPI003AF26E0F